MVYHTNYRYFQLSCKIFQEMRKHVLWKNPSTVHGQNGVRMSRLHLAYSDKNNRFSLLKDSLHELDIVQQFITCGFYIFSENK